MKKAFFILGFLGLVVINSAQTDSADIIVADSTEEISEISDISEFSEENDDINEDIDTPSYLRKGSNQ